VPGVTHANATSIQAFARIAGVLLLVSLVAGSFGELYVPSVLIVPGNAAATAHNIISSQSLFRMGFAGYLVEAVCDISLTWLLYVILKPVSADIALLAAFFRLVSTAIFAVAEFFYVAALLILEGAGYLKTFSPPQLNTLALLSLKLYSYGGGIFLVFYGVASIILGYLVARSGYLPKSLGLLFALGGLGFIVLNFTLILAPAYAFDFMLLPMTLAMLATAIWFLVRGVDISKLE